jgi:SNF2 family DNA or RNA helicase
MLIVDEAQNIKNHVTEQTKAIKKIKAENRIAMSGTPVENRLSDYWSIFDFVNRGYLGSFNSFNEYFAKPIHFNHDVARVEHFKRITAPFLLRRLKTDKNIISDLPDKVERNYYASLSTDQAALYQNIVNRTIAQIESSEGIERKGLVLKLMIALKQIGNHPYHYLRQGKKDIRLSGKSQLLAELVEDITESDEKVLVFTQFKEMGELLSFLITSITSVPPLFLHGGCSRKQRDEMVDKFQNSHNQVFILSLKAGGTGLNLTVANHVIHYDLWWNPAVETQATDRAFRIGQKKNVQVYRLINKGTIEEKIDSMIREKRYLADLTVTAGETWLGNLSNAELKDLVNLEH